MPPIPAHFNGFPKGFAEFLFSLRFNNTMELLRENKSTYQRFITEPLTQLFYALTPAALSVSETVITKPSKCVSTLYSDMRFSRQAPLKEYMYIRFREPFGEKDILGLYFDMGCDYYGYGIRIYNQTGAGMERIRKYAVLNSQAFARELEKLSLMKMSVKGSHFKRSRYPEVQDPALRDFLNKKGFFIERARFINGTAYCNKLQDEIESAYAGIKELYALLRSALYGDE